MSIRTEELLTVYFNCRRRYVISITEMQNLYVFYRLINYKMCYSIMINYVYNDSNMIGFFHFSAHSSSERAKVPTNA